MLCSSCYKSRQTSLTVEVRNSAGQIVNGVLVKVQAEPTSNLEGQELLIDYEEATNSNGIAFFNLNEVFKFGQTGVAVLLASVQQNNLFGSEVIEIVEEIDNRVDLVIQ
jgi:hypothetical protein